MKITYDKDVDALYISLKRGRAHRTSEKDGNILVDFDEKGNAVGIEVLRFSASFSAKNKIEILSGTKRILIPA